MKFTARFIFSVIILMLPFFATAQNLISGKVIDSKTKEVVSFATVFLKQTPLSVATDSAGNFSINPKVLPDTMLISFVGYETRRIWMTTNAVDLKIDLVPAEFKLTDFTVYSGENPADIIVKKIIEKKADNTKENLSSYQYEVYNKIEIDADNFPDKLKDKKIMEPFSSLFHNYDTTANGSPVVPLLLCETISEIYHLHNGNQTKEIIEANKISGVQNASAAQFSGNMYTEFNIYNNYFNLGTISFVSPFANNALFFYKYYIQDSIKNDSVFSYKLKFKPRRPGENTFTGFFRVDMKTMAITDITMGLSEKSNINFVENFSTHEEFAKADSTHYMMTGEQTIIYFTLEDKAIGLVGRKTTSYEKFKINSDSTALIFKEKSNIVLSDDVNKKTDEYWNENRHVPLDQHEKDLYKAIDSLTKNKKFIFYQNLITTLSSGYLVQGNFEIGPYYNFYSNNDIEGSRVRFGARTSNKFSTSLMIYGYGAYGFGDDRFKYNGGFLYLLNKLPRSYFRIDVLNDFENNGNHFDENTSDNLFGAFRRKIPQKLVNLDAQKLIYMKEWKSGFSNKVQLLHEIITPFFPYDYVSPDELMKLHNEPVDVAEVTYSLRFAYQEKFLSGEFLRTSVGSIYPIVELKYTAGIKGILNSTFNYHKIEISEEDYMNLNPIGEADVTISAGKTFGALPYFMLNAAKGNETFYYNYYTFNGLNRYQFLADKYVQLIWSQSLNGFPWSRIPGIRKFKWRSLVVFKGFYGGLSQTNLTANQAATNSFIVPNDKPYMEIDYGVRNILHLFRIDVFAPLTYRDVPFMPKWGIRGSVEFQF